MAASSVTGVGQGSVEGQNKGSKHFSVGSGRIIGPRVVMAGKATLAAGTKTVVLPALSGVLADYCVVTGNGTAATAHGAVMTFPTNATQLVLTGGTTDVINWAIIKTGQAV